MSYKSQFDSSEVVVLDDEDELCTPCATGKTSLQDCLAYTLIPST